MESFTQSKPKNFKLVGKRSRAKFRLFCFPFAGGSASIYAQWHNYLPDHIEVVAVQLPGREDRIREMAYTTIEPLLESLYDEFLTMDELPFAFFGHSMGAVLCLAFSKYLEEHMQQLPQHVFISAAYPPDDSLNRKKLSCLSDVELTNEIKNWNGTPTEILNDPELFKYYLPMIKSDFELLDSVKLENYINYRFKCNLTIMAGKQDRIVKSELMKQWKKYSLFSCLIKLFDGDHFFILSEKDSVLSEIAHELRFLITEYYILN